MATTTIDPRIIKARGFTADFCSVHVVTCDPRTGGPARVASFAGSAYPRAHARMCSYLAETGRYAWLVRGTAAAFLPFPRHAERVPADSSAGIRSASSPGE